MKAIWNNTLLAESERTIVIEGNHYFPPESIKKEYFLSSDTHTTCHWKGVASYYAIQVEGKQNKDDAWSYPNASELAKNIEGFIAFWRGVEITN